MPNRFLLEVGLEEIPAPMIEPGVEALGHSLSGLLADEGLTPGPVRTLAGPRRLAVLIEGLPDRQPDREQLIAGPPVSAAFDEQNQPTSAARGFARKHGAGVDDLEVVETGRGRYVAVKRTTPGRELPELLAELAPRAVASLAWPRNMYWRESRFRFVRPIRWLLSLWNDQVVEFDLEGVSSGRHSAGHRFLGASRVEIAGVEQYVERLRAEYVLVDGEERLDRIREGLKARLPDGTHLVEDAGLLREVVELNEYPSLICGAFSPDFLKLPAEVLTTVLRHHQKYFSVENEDSGEIQPHFLAVINTVEDSQGKIRRGHEAVLHARLEDAAFFWENDRKRRLEDRLPDLEHILFQEKLGSYRQKTERIRRLCRKLAAAAEEIDADQLDAAARLCKVDLTTEMVRELPELQGVVGGLYARQEEYPEAVCLAIADHYLPVAASDPIPATAPGALLSLADRLDTLSACFGIGITPTGSSDPFALRRQAQGLIRILVDGYESFQIDFSLPELLSWARESLPGEEDESALRNFLEARMRHALQERGCSFDVINAVLAVGLQRLPDAVGKAEALAGIKGEEDFEALALSFKRIKNILGSREAGSGGVDEDALEEPAERELHRAFRDLRRRVDECLDERDYDGALRQIAGLRSSVDRFFDEVLVMTDEQRLRNNRLNLLEGISALFLQIADISEVVQPEQG